MQHSKTKSHKAKPALQAVTEAFCNWILWTKTPGGGSSGILCHGTFEINHDQRLFKCTMAKNGTN